MKNVILLAFVLFLFGCASDDGEGVKNYLEEPQWLIKDPHFAAYQDKRDELESQYLKKEITYADYMEKLHDLDNTYDTQVRDRNMKVTPSQY